MNQWEDLRLTQTMFNDRTLFCEGDADEFVEIIKRKRGSSAMIAEKAAFEQMLAESQLQEEPEENKRQLSLSKFKVQLAAGPDI